MECHTLNFYISPSGAMEDSRFLDFMALSSDERKWQFMSVSDGFWGYFVCFLQIQMSTFTLQVIAVVHLSH